MTQKPFAGIFPYLVSPIEAGSGTVREGVLRKLVDHLIERGVHGLSPLGSTGEFAYLSFEQRTEIVRTVVTAADGRVPVVPGVAAHATGEAIRQAERFLELGADGIILILQVYFPLSRAAIEDYFTTVAEAIPSPIVIYNNPRFLGADVTPDIIATLSHISNIQYVKEAAGTTGRILTILNRAGDRIKVFSASAHVPLLVFQLGGVGWMAGPACLLPAACVQLYTLAQEERWNEAWELQRSMWRINQVFQKYALAACVKAGLQQQGFDVGVPIPPQEPLTPQAAAEVVDVVQTVTEKL